MKWIFNKSKWIHKYIGLFLLLFLLWSASSGIILNHPELVSDIKVPSLLVPNQYRTENWNRSSLVEFIFMKGDNKKGFVGGKKGVWKTSDGGITFEKMSEGYTGSLYYGKVNDLLLYEKGDGVNRLFAASFGGLWMCDLADEKWEKIFPENGNIEIKKILKINDRLVVFTESDGFEASIGDNRYNFHKLDIKKDGEEKTKKVSLVRLFFDLHGGHAWGLAGKLLFDLTGLLIIFLSISAFYIWYFPKKWKKKKLKSSDRSFNFFHKYHLKLGIWAAIVLLLIGVTAFFLRPPFLVAIARGNIDVSMYPGSFPENPWDGKIHNALALNNKNEILLETTDGMWKGRDDFSGKFQKVRIPILVFVMGATVLEEHPQGGLIVGSFNGLFHVPDKGRAVDMLTNKPAGWVSPVRPAETMITGYFKTPDGGEFVTGFEKGIIPLKGSELKGRFKLPKELREDKSIPLWNYMFEIHNGRIFRDLIGEWYLLIIPLGSFLFILITVTGIFDWIYTWFRRKKYN